MNRKGLTERLSSSMIRLAMDDSVRIGSFGAGTWKGGAYTAQYYRLIDAMKCLAKMTDVRTFSGKLHLFNGKIYEPIDDNLVQDCFLELLKHYELPPWILGKKVFFESLLKAMKIDNELAANMNYVAFSNGVLDLSKDVPVLCPFDARFGVTYMHPYKYKPKAGCRLWLTFLRQVLPEKSQRKVLQMSMGMGLINRYEVGSLEQCLVLYGTGANGKSVVYNTMKGVFGSENFSAVSYVDLCSMGDEGLRARYALRGKRFNWCPDEDFRFFARTRTAEFKKIVSGEPVNDRVVRGQVGENTNLPYMAFNLNQLPKGEEGTEGLLRRLQVIHFGVTIPKEKRDVTLSRRLEDEYSGIFNWIVRGMRELKDRDYHIPDNNINRVVELQMLFDKNPCAAFVKAYGVRTKAEASGEQYREIALPFLMEKFGDFCRANGLDEQKIPNEKAMGWAVRAVKRLRKGVSHYCLYGVCEDDFEKVVVISDLMTGEAEDDREDKYIEKED